MESFTAQIGYNSAMQDRTINNALLALRKQMIREGGECLSHVEAVLIARGVHMPAVLPAKRTDVARRGQMRRQVMEAIRGGATLRQVAAHVASQRPELSERQAYIRSGQCLARLKASGLVTREGRVWLATSGQPCVTRQRRVWARGKEGTQEP